MFQPYFSYIHDKQDTIVWGTKVCQWLGASRWFSSGTPVSSTNKLKLTAKYIWNIVECDNNHHNPNPTPPFSLRDSQTRKVSSWEEFRNISHFYLYSIILYSIIGQSLTLHVTVHFYLHRGRSHVYTLSLYIFYFYTVVTTLNWCQ